MKELIIQINHVKTFHEQPGTVAHACCAQETETEFKASLGYVTRSCLKTKQNMLNVTFTVQGLPSTVWGTCLWCLPPPKPCHQPASLSLPPAWLFKVTQAFMVPITLCDLTSTEALFLQRGGTGSTAPGIKRLRKQL